MDKSNIILKFCFFFNLKEVKENDSQKPMQILETRVFI